MSDKHSLFLYRMAQADTTLSDAEKMLASGVGPRSIVNRCYYAMFYATLALFLKAGIAARTSRHSGVIGIFDKEFILTGKIDKQFSKMLHSVCEFCAGPVRNLSASLSSTDALHRFLVRIF